MEQVYEVFFFLKYSGGWSFSEAYNLPIGLRNWFTKRLVKQLETEKEAAQASRSNNKSSTHRLNSSNQPQLPKHLK